MKRLTMLVWSVALALVPAAGASADKPTREPFPVGNDVFPAGVVCSFPVSIEVLENREKVTTFSDGRQLVTGTLKQRVTNLATGESLDLNTSGPATITPSADGSVLTISGRGHSLLFFFSGEPGGPGLFLYIGHNVVTFDVVNDVVTSVRATGRRIDICAALA
jgi:hypothetical protein